MRAPATFQSGNLMWTRHGTVWANWILTGQPYGYGTPKAKQEARAMHQALMRALPGESLWLGLRAGLDPTTVVERMLEGVDIDRCPDWKAECAATLDSLDNLVLGTRVYWLAVPLADGSRWMEGAQAIRSAIADIKDLAGLPKTPPSTADLQRRRGQAERIRKVIPGLFKPQPATAAQMLWLQSHAQQRGLFADSAIPPTTTESTTRNVRAAVPTEPLLDEGGQTDRAKWTRHGVNPVEHRYLKITPADVPDEPAASYQVMATIADLPRHGMLFPGSEFVGNIDTSGIDVDWAIRMQVRSSDEVEQKNRRALTNLNDQLYQRSDEISTTSSDVTDARDKLTEYLEQLASDKLEVEVAATVIFAVGGASGKEAIDSGNQLARFLRGCDIRAAIPLGYQMELWWAMQPGAPTPQAVRAYAQISTSKNWSAVVPFAATDLGDRKGSLLGINQTSGLPGVVYHDLEGSSELDVSGSALVAGELGAGKTYTIKKLGNDVVDRGGILVIPDRTEMGEWEVWASAVASACVVNIADPAYSLCPLQLFGQKAGAQALESFLLPLLDLKPTSAQGVLLSDVLDPDYLRAHDITSTGGLLTHLLDGCELDGAQELGRLINVFARKDFGRVVFDPTLPPLPAGWQALVIRTHSVALPSQDEIDKEHLFRQMKLEKVYGRAIYALIAAVARRICFTDRARLGLFMVAEAHHVTLSPESETEITTFVRDGRKHKAAVIMDSHDPEADIPSGTLRGLIPTRILMRQRDRDLAKSGLRWLGLDPDDELVELVTTQLSPAGPDGVPANRRGEGLMRDMWGRLGVVQVLPPALDSRRAAASTSPSTPDRPTPTGAS